MQVILLSADNFLSCLLAPWTEGTTIYARSVHLEPRTNVLRHTPFIFEWEGEGRGRGGEGEGPCHEGVRE